MSPHKPASQTLSLSGAEGFSLPSREALATALEWLARLGLLLTLALSGWRYRWVIVAWPSPPVYEDYTSLLLFPSDFTLLLALAAWGLARWMLPRAWEWGPVFLTLPLGGVLIAAWLSVPFSVNPALSLYLSVRLLVLAGLYFLVMDLARDLRLLAFAAGLLILSQAPLGVMQLLQQESLGLQALGEYELNPAWSGVSVVAAGGSRLLRAYALTDHPNLLGGILAFSLFLVSAGFLRGRRPWRIIYVGLFGLGLVGVLASFSRAAALALAAGMALYGLLLARRRSAGETREWLALLAVSGLILAPFLAQYAPYLGARVGVAESFVNEATERRSLQERAALNRAANEIFAEHPLTGVGLGALPLAMEERFPDFPYYFQPAHLVVLDVAAETGLFGSFFFALALVLPWIALIRLTRQRRRVPHGLIAASGLLLALTVVGLVDYYPWLLQPGRLWQWLAWGVWARQYTDALQGGTDA